MVLWKTVPYRRIRFPRVGSTNDIALDAARAGEEPGLAVVADVQTHGKGRSARDWISPEGGLWASILLEAQIPARLRGLAPLAVGCACCRALEDLGAEVQLRWPNDLMRSDAKLGGLLVEARSEGEQLTSLVAGMGINVTNEPPVDGAANLDDLSVTRDDLLEAIFERLPSMETALRRGESDRICRVFMEHAWGIGREMRLDGERVVPKDVAVDGALIVEDLDGEVSVHRTGSLRTAESSDPPGYL